MQDSFLNAVSPEKPKASNKFKIDYENELRPAVSMLEILAQNRIKANAIEKNVNSHHKVHSKPKVSSSDHDRPLIARMPAQTREM